MCVVCCCVLCVVVCCVLCDVCCVHVSRIWQHAVCGVYVSYTWWNGVGYACHVHGGKLCVACVRSRMENLHSKHHELIFCLFVGLISVLNARYRSIYCHCLHCWYK